MFTYTAKSYSLAADFRHAAKELAAKGMKATVKGMVLKTEAEPAQVGQAIKAAYAKYAY
jgi:hypothetical protein